MFNKRVAEHAHTRRKGNRYDNSAMESCWATLKTECFGTTIPATGAQAHLIVFDYIETFDNPVRLHNALHFQSPINFEKNLQLN